MMNSRMFTDLIYIRGRECEVRVTYQSDFRVGPHRFFCIPNVWFAFSAAIRQNFFFIGEQCRVLRLPLSKLKCFCRSLGAISTGCRTRVVGACHLAGATKQSFNDLSLTRSFCGVFLWRKHGSLAVCAACTVCAGKKCFANDATDPYSFYFFCYTSCHFCSWHLKRKKGKAKRERIRPLPLVLILCSSTGPQITEKKVPPPQTLSRVRRRMNCVVSSKAHSPSEKGELEKKPPLKPCVQVNFATTLSQQELFAFLFLIDIPYYPYNALFHVFTGNPCRRTSFKTFTRSSTSNQ